MQTFEQWWNEIEGYGLRAERFTTPGDAAEAAWDQAMSLRAQADARPVAPFWHAVVSASAPIIDKAIRRQDVAEEYADKCRENYSDVRVVALYTHPEASAPGLSDDVWRVTDDDWEAIYEKANASFRRHQSATKGQQISPADGFDYHVVGATAAFLKDRLTRASAATVAEPSEKPAAWLYDHPGSGPNLSFTPPSGFDKNELSEMEVTVHALYTHAISDEGASYKRMFEDAVRSLAAIGEALGIDPDEAGDAEPIIEAIEHLKAAQQQAEPGEGDAPMIFMWFARGTGNEDGQFIRAWTSNAARVKSLQDAIGKPPIAYVAAHAEPGVNEGEAFAAAMRAPEFHQAGDATGWLGVARYAWLAALKFAAQSGQRADVAEGWQPIKTAPDDGTEFVGYDPSYGVGQMFGDWNRYWWLCSTDRQMHPTHWMPLPAAPTQQGASDAED